MCARADLHFHALPGVDDGPRTMEEAVTLARTAVADGSAVVAATPHVRHDQVTDVRGLPERVRELQDRLHREGVPLTVHCGAELDPGMVGHLSHDELDTIALGPPGARWLLLECPFGGGWAALHDAARELRERGFGVLLAHPERSADPPDAWAVAVQRELGGGSRLQVGVASLSGEHGERAAAAAGGLVRGGLAWVLASDAHGPQRPPMLSRGLWLLRAQGVPVPAARALVGARTVGLLERGFGPPERTAAAHAR